jgi:Ca2+-binding RTX toxin-like protein
MSRFNLSPLGRPFGFALATVAMLAGVAGPGSAAAAIDTTFNTSSDTLLVVSDADDAIKVGCANGGVFVNAPEPGEAAISCSAVAELTVRGGPGSNVIDVSGVTPAQFATLSTVELSGGADRDRITGSVLADGLDGGDDPDVLIGAGGADTILGGDDNDAAQWFDGDGSDTIEGGAGNDVVAVTGSAEAGDAIDVAASGERARIVRTNPTPFSLDAGTVEQVLVRGGDGDDVLAGQGPLPFGLRLDGDVGDDSLTGTAGGDLLVGGAGNDLAVGRGGEDRVTGGEGADTAVLTELQGNARVEGDAGLDSVEVSGSTQLGDELAMEAVADVPDPDVDFRAILRRLNLEPFEVIVDETERLTVNGGDGADVITGSKPMPEQMEFTFQGAEGADTLQGTDGVDILRGGSGPDLLGAEDSRPDRLRCGGGDDIARVDTLDRPRDCEITEGGDERVRIADKTLAVVRGVATLRLRCARTGRCHGTARLRHGERSLGKAGFAVGRHQVEAVRIRLNDLGRRLLGSGPRGRALPVALRIDARDAAGNGWRSTERVKLRDAGRSTARGAVR